MNRIPFGLVLLVGFASAPAVSQRLQQPAVPAAKPAPAQAGAGPQLKQSRPMQAPRVPADPGQRPQSSNPIPGTGPAKQVPAGQAAATAGKSPANVLDANGRPVNGMVQVAPNRVYDPTTGRYHWTRMEGQQQKLID